MQVFTVKHVLLSCLLVAGTTSILPAAAEAPPPIEAFTRLPNLYDAQLSPDGERLAVLMPIDGKKTLVILPTDKASAIKPQVAGAGDWEIDSFFWKTPEELYSVLSQTDRVVGTQPIPKSRMMHFNVITQKIVLFWATKASKLEAAQRYNRETYTGFTLRDPLPTDPDHLLVEVGGDAVKVDIHNESSTIVQHGAGAMTGWFVDDQGTVRAAQAEGVGDDKLISYSVDAGGQLARIDTSHFASGTRFEIIGVAKDPSHLVVLSDHEDGHLAAYEFDPATRSYVQRLAAAPGHDVEDPIFWAGRLVGVSNPTPVYFDAESKALQSLIDKALPDTRDVIVQMTADHHFALVRADAADKPTALYRLTLGDKKKLDLIGADYPELEGLSLAPVKKVQYAARDGQQIEAILTLPAGQKGPLPFVVLPHGGPTAQDDDTFDYWAQFLASRGYGVLQPNFRGSTGYGAAFQRAGYGQWGGLMQNDVDDGTKWLIDQHLAASGRICIVGGSYGGYVALEAATSRPDLYRCAAAWAPVTDVGDLIHRINLFDYRDPNLPTLGKTGANPDEISPARHADKAAMPILIGHGEEDYTVPVEHTRAMEAALKKAGKPAEVVYYKGENHYLSLASTRKDFFARLEAFLGRNIGSSATQ